MAFPSAFHERLQQMEETKNQRLSLLQAEKELQNRKSMLLAAKMSNLRRLEQRCLILEQKSAKLSFQVLAKKTEMEALDFGYQSVADEFRTLKSEIDDLQEQEMERKKFYDLKSLGMKEFRAEVERYVMDFGLQVEKMRNTNSELKLSLKQLQANDGYLGSTEIAAAEKMKNELLAVKVNLDRSLASNYHLRSVLQKQLCNFLSQDRKRT